MDSLDLLTSWTQAVLAEREEDRSRFELLQSDLSLKARRAEGLTWSPVEVTKASYAFGGAKWSLRCSEGGGLSGAFRVGSAVALKPIGDEQDVQEIGTWPARVMKVRGLELDVVLDGDGPEGVAIQHISWTLDARSDERSFNAMAHALSHWVNVEDESLLSFRDVVLGFDNSFGSAFVSEVEMEEVDLTGLNDQQIAAVKSMGMKSLLTLLHGPPGTGKTKTLVAGMKAMTRRGERILATAPSNMAVDVLVERLNSEGLNVVRVGHPMRVSEEAMSRTLDARIMAQPEYGRVVKTRQEAEQRQREADRYVRNFGADQRENRRVARAEARLMRKEAEDLENYLSDRVLREAEVVCATLVGCDDRRLRNLNFDVAVVDEAAQALPPATLIPMRRANRLVLCGDPCQLPPTVKSLDARVLETTLLERLIDMHPNETVMLNVQHRMHQAIMSAGNAKFYGGKLFAHPSVAKNEIKGIQPWMWVDTAGCGYDEDRSEEGGSVSNKEEARFVLNRAEDWLQIDPTMSLGIVAPYSAQVELLRELMHDAMKDGRISSHADVTIHTVDGFQGQERDGILVSMTRSNSRGEVGFLVESRRIHVAQTRAKKACMLVGDGATLGTDPYLSWLMEHAQQHEAYDSAWSWLV